MEEEIGKTAGAIWQALSTQGDLSLTQLKNQVKANAPISTGSSVAAWWVFLCGRSALRSQNQWATRR
jgi:Winged helix-turn-helix domain (DUF2582)